MMVQPKLKIRINKILKVPQKMRETIKIGKPLMEEINGMLRMIMVMKNMAMNTEMRRMETNMETKNMVMSMELKITVKKLEQKTRFQRRTKIKLMMLQLTEMLMTS
jgi:hypothetical protein